MLFSAQQKQASKDSNLVNFMNSLDEALIHKMNSQKSEYNFDFQKEAPLFQND